MDNSHEAAIEAFLLFDKDNDGKLSIEDLGTVLRALGHCLTTADVKEIGQQLGTPTVDKAQFTKLLDTKFKAGPKNIEEPLIEAFKVFDRSGTGVIEVSELRHILTSLGEKLDPEMVDGVLKECDSDHDGKINVKDFLRVVQSAKS